MWITEHGFYRDRVVNNRAPFVWKWPKITLFTCFCAFSIGRGGDPTRTNWTGKIPPQSENIKMSSWHCQHCQSSFGQSWNADILTLFAAFLLVSAVKIWGRLIDILSLKILFFWMGLFRGGNFSSSFCPGGVTSSPYADYSQLLSTHQLWTNP